MTQSFVSLKCDIWENKQEGHATLPFLEVTQHAAQWSYGTKYSKLKKTIEIQLVRPAEVCGKVLSEKNDYRSVKTALLLSNVVDTDHQKSCLFTNKGHFSSPFWVINGILAKSYE